MDIEVLLMYIADFMIDDTTVEKNLIKYVLDNTEDYDEESIKEALKKFKDYEYIY